MLVERRSTHGQTPPTTVSQPYHDRRSPLRSRPWTVTVKRGAIAEPHRFRDEAEAEKFRALQLAAGAVELEAARR